MPADDGASLKPFNPDAGPLAAPGGLSAIIPYVTQAGATAVLEVAGDLYLSDPGLASRYARRPAGAGPDPFPGLGAFGPAQAEWFHGRRAATAKLTRLVSDQLRIGSGGPVVVTGQGGAGKSSLLGAGLLAEITQGRLPQPGSAFWPRLVLSPGARPATALRAALETIEQARARAGEAGDPVIIIVDQLEEIFTECPDERERAGFLAELTALAAPAVRPGLPPAAVVVLGLRAECYAQATAEPVLAPALESRQLVLGAMSYDDVRAAITGPALQAGRPVDEDLVDLLLRDLGASPAQHYEPSRLPLLAHALRAAWSRCDGTRLTAAGYAEAGRVDDAVERTAEAVYRELGDAGQRAARAVFLRLVRPDDAVPAGENTRHPAGPGAAADFPRPVSARSARESAGDPAAARAALAAFAAAGLLTDDGQTVALAHPALLARWPRLRRWISADQAGRLQRQRIEADAAAWAAGGRREVSALYRGDQLAEARALAEPRRRGRSGGVLGRKKKVQP